MILKETSSGKYRVVGDRLPFFKTWLKNNDYYNKALEFHSSKQNSKIDDFFVCWIYGKCYKDEHDVSAAHSIFFSELEDIRRVSLDCEDEFLIKKKLRFDYYKHLKEDIENGYFFKTDYDEKTLYNRIMNKQSAMPDAREYGVDF